MSDALIRMPKLADTLVEGTVGQWLKRVGDAVERGEPLASIETDKVTTELTSPASGTLLELLVGEGQTVAIETPIARIGATEPEAAQSLGLAASSPPADASDLPPRTSELSCLPPADTSDPGPRTSEVSGLPPAVFDALRSPGGSPLSEPREPPKVTPLAARLLAEHGLAPSAVPTRARRLTRADVLAFVHQRQPQPTPDSPLATGVAPLSSMRRAIADHMVRARQTIPHGQTVMAADLTRLVAWRDQHREAFLQDEGASLTFTVFFVYALARVLGPPAGIGVAVALEEGLIVPVLPDPSVLSLADTARGIADLAARARSGRLAPDATQGAAMTVTNVGSFGNLTAAPIVPVGQLGILAPGVVERRPLPAPHGGIRLGWRCLLSLVYDRRAFDDPGADRFLRRVVDELTSMPDRVPVSS